MGVGVGEPARKQHLVRAQPDPRDKVVGLECGLLHLGVEVGQVAVERHRPDLDQRVVAVRPHLGQIERVEPVGLGLLERHDLHVQRPAREVAVADRLEQVLAVVVGVLAGQPVGILLGQEVDPLIGLEVVLDPELVAAGVDPHVGVTRVAVHVTVGLRDAAVAHQPGHHVGRLGRERPEVPLHVVVTQPVVGRRFWLRMKCWNFIGSRTKKIGVLLPTMS